MRFGLDVAQHQLTWDELVGRVRLAEEAGFEGAWVFDHFRPLFGDPSGPCFEAWSVLAALAAATERIRLGALVTGVTYRHPSVLAAQAVTVDHVSRGRLDIGIGAAWHEPEHRALGIEFPPVRERARMVEEAVVVMRLLMTEEDASYGGRHFRLEGATYTPRPVQRPHPPIWIGASGERLMLPIAARQADVWHGFGDLASLVHKSSALDRLAEEAGRDPASIVRATHLSISEPLEEVRRRIDALAEAGFSVLTVGWPTEGLARVEAFVADVLPEYAA